MGFVALDRITLGAQISNLYMLLVYLTTISTEIVGVISVDIFPRESKICRPEVFLPRFLMVLSI